MCVDSVALLGPFHVEAETSLFPEVYRLDLVREFNIEDEDAQLGKTDYADAFRDKAEEGNSYPSR